MTKLCRSYGEELLDSSIFCDRCGAAQPTRSPQPESHPMLAESVPKTEMDFRRASLVARISDLEAKLSESVPRQEADKLHVRLRQLESLLAESVPRREAKAKAALEGKSMKAWVEEVMARELGKEYLLKERKDRRRR